MYVREKADKTAFQPLLLRSVIPHWPHLSSEALKVSLCGPFLKIYTFSHSEKDLKSLLFMRLNEVS